MTIRSFECIDILNFTEFIAVNLDLDPFTRSSYFFLQVADFGMARQLETGNRIDTFSCGTITHSAPELMDEGHLSPAVVRPLYTHPGVPHY